LDYAHLMH